MLSCRRIDLVRVAGHGTNYAPHLAHPMMSQSACYEASVGCNQRIVRSSDGISLLAGSESTDDANDASTTGLNAGLVYVVRMDRQFHYHDLLVLDARRLRNDEY